MLKVFEKFGDVVMCIEVVYAKYGICDSAVHFYKDGKKVYAIYHELPLEYVYVEEAKKEITIISLTAAKKLHLILKRYGQEDWEKLENTIRKTNKDVVEKIIKEVT